MGTDIEMAAKIVARQLRERQAWLIQNNVQPRTPLGFLLEKLAKEDIEMAELLESAQKHEDRRKEQPR